MDYTAYIYTYLWMSTAASRKRPPCGPRYQQRESGSQVLQWSAAADGPRLVGSIKLHVSFAEKPYKRDIVLQKRPIILSILLCSSGWKDGPWRRLTTTSPAMLSRLNSGGCWRLRCSTAADSPRRLSPASLTVEPECCRVCVHVCVSTHAGSRPVCVHLCVHIRLVSPMFSTLLLCRQHPLL